MDAMDSATLVVRGDTVFIRQFEVAVVDGPDRGARVTSQSDELSIGTSEGNDLRLADPAVSRHHCALRAGERGLALADLGSRNGTFLGDVEVLSCFVRSGVRFRVGQSLLELHILDHDLAQPLATGTRYGPIIGGSVAMRRLYPLIEEYARSTSTLLISGETGTGKELFAEAIHEASDRRGGPFVVVDCSALTYDLAESELFGHERGAFTGAEKERIGAFESAQSGTVFLDEIGELPLAVQRLLLRVLESRTIRRVGSNQHLPVDVRVIAASHRDLRVEVNEKRFRPDLYYRLNVLRIAVPALREREGDVELLAEHFWRAFRPDLAPPASLLRQVAGRSWPGNVRELRNTVERIAQLGELATAPPAGAAEPLSYGRAKEQALWHWERAWIEHLLAASGGNLARAARAARMGRSHLRLIARKHGLAVRAGGGDPADDAD
jgi:transcriptional regulator with GAF, ATPase, and Fis domain